MEICNNTEVLINSDNNEDNEDDKISWKPLFHQLLVCSGIWACYFVFGLSMGAFTVLVPQMRNEVEQTNSTDVISSETVSWLVSSSSYASIPWLFILPALTNRFGRIMPFRLIGITAIISSFIFYFSSNLIHILISEIFLSVLLAGQVPVYFVILSEFSSPRYRGIFLTIKSASFSWGIWSSNAIGTFFHWRNIGILQIICSLYIFISTLYWSESPFWLASRGRFEECRNAYQRLRGTSREGIKELEYIINSEKHRSHSVDLRNKPRSDKFCKIITRKKIYKPLLLCMTLYIFYHSTGKLICLMYAIDIIKTITSSESDAYTVMLILDGVTVISMYVGCVLSKYLHRRMMFFSTSFVGVSFLFIISFYLYLTSISVIGENKYVTTLLLMVYSVSVSVGPIILISTICSELLPLEHRSLVTCAVGIYDRIVMGTSLKISPYIFSSFGTHGAFFFFTLSSTCFLLLLYKYLPETKGKTLHEIEKLMAGDEIFENDEK